MTKHRNTNRLTPKPPVTRVTVEQEAAKLLSDWKGSQQQSAEGGKFEMTPEQRYDNLIAPNLANLANLAKNLGMSLLALVDYGDDPNNLDTGIIMSTQETISPTFMLATVAARSGGNFDTLVSLLRQVNPSHNSVALTLLGFMPPGANPPGPVEFQLQEAWRLLRDHNLMFAADVIQAAIDAKRNEPPVTE